MFSETNRIINEWIPGTPLKLSKLKLNKLPNIPFGVETLDISDNDITHIHSLPRTIKSLNCSRNKIVEIFNLPIGIENLNLSNNKIEKIDLRPYKSLKILNLVWNYLTDAPPLPESLEVLLLSHNRISTLRSIKTNLLELVVCNCGLDKIIGLPTSLKTLDCRENYLTSLCHLPFSLRTLDCSDNSLTSLSALPPDLRILRCDNNKLLFLPYLPPSLEVLNARNNNIQVAPIFSGTIGYRLDNNPFLNRPKTLKLSKDYTTNVGKDVIKNQDLGTAYDYINLEDVNINEYLNQSEKNIILVLGNQKYAVSRDDLIDSFNNTVFESGSGVCYRTPWNQIIKYDSASHFQVLDYSIFELQQTNIKILKQEIEHSVYNVKAFKCSDYT